MLFTNSDKMKAIESITRARRSLAHLAPENIKQVEEGGCGVTGFASSIRVAGRHIFEPSKQMHNRGNGKGGGIAAMGLDAATLGVSEKTLDECYLLQIAFLDPDCQKDVEDAFITSNLEVEHAAPIVPVDDYRDIEGLDVRPPDVMRYFVRAKAGALEKFMEDNQLSFADERKAEDEYIYQNTFKLNSRFYAGGIQKAFVLSHGRNLMVLKIVGYAEKVVQYYQLDDFKANIWIAHQRFPTKGRVWHPGGAHPFVGLNEALVHNGDFANYHSVSEYLRQRSIYPLFMTDTEVSALMFDLLTRTYGYPLEYVIEALAPTSEMDFDQLPEDKQKIYSLIQSSHIHGSPDGPWFFIIARNDIDNKALQLIGITDTAMLRPQVFALMDGEVKVGLVCSEKQAIDATLKSLADEDERFGRVADTYWNARGGSHTDGGSFIFNIIPKGNDSADFVCTDKFGQPVTVPENQIPYEKTPQPIEVSGNNDYPGLSGFLGKHDAAAIYETIAAEMEKPGYDDIMARIEWLKKQAATDDDTKKTVIEALTLLLDRRYNTFDKRRRSILEPISIALDSIFSSCRKIGDGEDSRYAYIDFASWDKLTAPKRDQEILVINAHEFKPEGNDCDARLQVDAFELGWKQFICFGYRGQRFTGNGLGPDTQGVRFDVYGSSGDYLASGIDGMHIYVHGNGQDQLCQIIKQGRLVVHGDVGQTFMYGAKGGDAYILGSAAGRPLINGVGRPRVVINGTCLDYLAESFMAGDPLNGGGFVILNGMRYNWEGKFVDLPTPYPGSNLFSLASGGAIYIRDPEHKLVDEQLNGGILDFITREDWELILPYLEENEKLFGISIEKDLLTIDGHQMDPGRVYRKVKAVKSTVLAGSEENLVPE